MDDGGFKKFEFGNRTSVSRKIIEVKEQPKMKKLLLSKKKRILAGFIILIILLSIVSVFVGIKAKSLYNKSLKIYNQAKVASASVKQQNIVQAKEELLKTEKEIKSFQTEYQSLQFIQYIPIAASYYNDGNHMVNASLFGIKAGVTVMDSLIPYADVLGLKGDKSFVGGSAEDRIQTAVKSLGKIVPNIDKIEVHLIKAREEIDQIDPGRYPNFSKFKEVRKNIEIVKNITDESVVAIQEAKPLIKVLPDLLGEPESKKYLVLFQNDKELRSTGGFITFYTVFRVEHGVIRIDSASDIYDLDSSIASHPKAPEVILTYLPKVYAFNIRDSNLSPDFVESMKMFNSLYDKASKKTNIDGIIAIDTNVLVHFLEILGDVQAGGVTFSSKPDARCSNDCPHVVYELESYATTQVGHVIDNRKSIIGELLYAIMGKALSSSPGEYWGRLFQQGLKDAQEKHILIYLYNKDAQSGIEALNLAGRIKDFQGDYLHINENNYGGAKSNMFIKQKVKIEYELDDKGSIAKTITISYKNPHPPSNCNLEQKEILCLNAQLRNYLRLYVPKGSILQSSKGSQVKVSTKEELGKTYFDSFLTVDPLGSSSIIFKYRLPFKIEKGSPLPFLIQKQPGTFNIDYEIYVNGKKQEEFVLNEDRILNLKVF